MVESMFHKELTLIKQVNPKNLCFAIISILKMLVINFNSIFVMVAVSMMAYDLKKIAILNVKGVDYRCILWGNSRNEVVNRFKNSLLEDKSVL